MSKTNLKSNEKFNTFVRKYQRWSGKAVTPEQKEQMLTSLAERGLELELDKLINKLDSNPASPDEISLDIN